MRLWSLHPKYLDTKGIVALWREALLAQAVLRGDTRGDQRHPQLERFKSAQKPLDAIAAYLSAIHKEADRRRFKFDASKIGPRQLDQRIPVTEGQIDYEFVHLKQKLAHRSAASLARLNAVKRPEPHPLFAVIPGAVETWERVQTGSLAAAVRKPPQSISVKPKNTGGQIKAATMDDVSILTGLIRKSYRDVAQRFSLTPENCPRHPSNCTDDWIRNDFARGVSYYILEHNGRQAGCAALEKPDPDLGYLERLAVLPASRRKGFGRMLVDHVFSRAKDSGIQKISIGIIAAQTDLKRWYQKIGFIEGATKEFTHLPFPVTFMTCSLPGKGGINAS